MLVKNSLRFSAIVSCSVIPWALGGIISELADSPIVGVIIGLGTFIIGMFICLRLMKKWYF